MNDFRGGVIPIYKPQGITSFDVVAKVRRLFGTKQVGHTGTLDPMATGVLVVLVGRAVKASDYVMSGVKAYRAGMRLGIETDTEDTTGKLISQSDVIPARDDVIAAANTFIGDSMQIPPMYSALKIGGKKLVDMARQGVTVERTPRPITVYSLTADGDGRDYTLCIRCSAGTYIRTICADIGRMLGCGAAMSALERTECGGFDIGQTVTIEEIENTVSEKRADMLIPCEELLSGLPSVRLEPFYERLCLNGCEIYQKKIKTGFDVGAVVRMYGADGFFGIGRVGEYENGTAVKLEKRL